jgi:DNA invertase Pin-like site-specific DNA recombinase
MVAAKQRGKRIGRPRKPFLEEVVLAHSRIEAGEGTVAEIAAAYGCSRKSLAQELERLMATGTIP